MGGRDKVDLNRLFGAFEVDSKEIDGMAISLDANYAMATRSTTTTAASGPNVLGQGDLLDRSKGAHAPGGRSATQKSREKFSAVKEPGKTWK